MTAIDIVVIVLCVLVVVGVAVGWAVRRKKGKTGCCGECSHCKAACPSADGKGECAECACKSHGGRTEHAKEDSPHE